MPLAVGKVAGRGGGGQWLLQESDLKNQQQAYQTLVGKHATLPFSISLSLHRGQK